jgi:phenylpropionate dioxygenase-like ring-hydroxylating dioxygenase large terminal subunit
MNSREPHAPAYAGYAGYAGYVTEIDASPDVELTQTGRGTPGGEHLRRFWQPVAYEHELGAAPLRVRIMGEDLVVFRDRSGDVGVLHLHCQHRGTSLEYGRVEEHGIRCCYHGRVFGVDGTLLEMPGEPNAERLSAQYRQGAYPAHLFAGLVFAYMGPPDRKPPFPMYDKYRVPGLKLAPGPRMPFACNWVQVKENAMDPAHTAILHAWEGRFADEFGKFPEITWIETPAGMAYLAARHVNGKVWTRSTDIMAPNIHSLTSVFEDGRALKDCSPPWLTIWTVPVDDHACINFTLCHLREDDATPDEVRNRAMLAAGGQTPDRPYAARQSVPGDYDAMVSQGSITRHSLEHLGTLDQGVVMFRRQLRQAIRDVQAGKEPHGLIRGDRIVPTYGSDRVVDASAVPGDPEDPHALRAYIERVAREYLEAPPLQGGDIPPPPPLPAHAYAPAGSRPRAASTQQPA